MITSNTAGPSSVFASVVQAPVIEAAALSEECSNDDFPKKVNLTLGGKDYLFTLVF